MTMFERIKELAKSKDKNLKQVALEMGFGENYFYTLKKQSPKAETLQQIADYFDVSADYLLGRTDVKRFEEPETIAAHHEGEDWTEEELEEIEEFKRFVAMKREARKNKEN